VTGARERRALEGVPWRATVATVFVVVHLTWLLAGGDGWADREEVAWTVLFAALYFTTGLLIGRWWALALLPVPVALAAIPDPTGEHAWWGTLLIWTLAYFGPAFIAGLLVRMLIRRVQPDTQTGGRRSPNG
jgi:hypothetical protein